MPCSTFERVVTLFSISRSSLKPVRMPHFSFRSSVVVADGDVMIEHRANAGPRHADDAEAVDRHVVGPFEVDAVGRHRIAAGDGHAGIGVEGDPRGGRAVAPQIEAGVVAGADDDRVAGLHRVGGLLQRLPGGVAAAGGGVAAGGGDEERGEGQARLELLQRQRARTAILAECHGCTPSENLLFQVPCGRESSRELAQVNASPNV